MPVLPVIGAENTDRYRNKVQLPVGTDENGHLIAGFYAGRSHRIVLCEDCKLQPKWMNLLKHRYPDLYGKKMHLLSVNFCNQSKK